MMTTYRAYQVEQQEETVHFKQQQVTTAALAPDTVRIQVAYSSINYKDVLATQANGGVIRKYPMTPGIDLSGTIVATQDARFEVGQAVLVTGYGLGVSHPGGFAEIATVPGDWVIPLPSGMSLREAMQYGTAGFTAGLSVQALTEVDRTAPILVSGATGGVGSVALLLLRQMGFTNRLALIRHAEQQAWVEAHGATEIVMADELMTSSKPLQKQRFGAAVDTVGGAVASAIVPQLAMNGIMTMCGNSAGIAFDTNVLPFILRGISVFGIDSVQVDHQKREAVWTHLATDWRVSEQIPTREIGFDDLPETIAAWSTKRYLGRTIVRVAD